MALQTREITNKLSSGEITEIKLNGTSTDNDVLMRSEIDSAISAAVQALDPSWPEKPIGLLFGKVANQDFTTSFAHIDGYTTEYGLNITKDALTGLLTPLTAGSYRATVNLSITVPTDAATRIVYLQLYDIDSLTELETVQFTIPENSTEVGHMFSKIIFPTVGNDIVVRVKASTSITGVTFDDVSFDLELLNTTI